MKNFHDVHRELSTQSEDIDKDLLNDGELYTVDKLDFGSTWSMKIILRYLMVLNFYQTNVENRDNPNMLELGCSNGKLLKLYQNHFRSPLFNNPNYIGVDASQKFIKKANEFLENNNNRNFYNQTKFICHNILFESLWNELSRIKYDFVVMMEVIEHLPFDKHNWLINKIADNMKENSYFVISTPVHYSRNEELYYPEDHINEYFISDLYQLVLNRFEIVTTFGFNIKSRQFKKKLRESNPKAYQYYKLFNQVLPAQITLSTFDLALSKTPEFLTIICKLKGE